MIFTKLCTNKFICIERDKCACIKLYVLADAKGLSNPAEVEMLREKVYASLESYTKQKYPNQPGR